ncbi:MAG: 50S ribosomal protein L9 [Bacteroidota bacterium]
MEIILLKDMDKVGDKYDIVSVKDGYGRNYLIPQGFALIANEANRQQLDEYKAKEAEKEAARKGEFLEMADKLKDQVLKIGAKAGQSGKIFGSVTTVQLASALNEQFEIEVERRKIELPEEVKTLGEYVAQIKFHPEVIADVKFEVVAE